MCSINYLSKTVTVTVDRPLGSVHPEHTDILYSVNYGYIEGEIAPDGEFLDAYILGVNEPVKTFTGKVIAVLHRLNDIEDKLVVAPFDRIFNQAEILETVNFQEKYFKSEITCLHEKSCGAVVCRKKDEVIEFLILFQHKSQTWSFPKGHAVAFENEQQTAQREIKEEIGLSVQFVDGFRESLTYPIYQTREKEVVLFLSLIKEEVSLLEDEISHFVWADKQTAAELLNRKEYIPILDKAEARISL